MSAARVLVIQHEDDAPAAWIGTWLVEAGCELDVRRPYLDDPAAALPPDLGDHDGVVVLGGEMGAHDDEVAPWLPATRELVRRAARDGVPTLGICLGHQLCTVALGGEIGRNPRGQQLGVLETGWTPEAVDDPLVGGLLDTARGLQWNSDLVTRLPDGATVLARTPHGELQAARLASTVWGVQLHPEVDESIVTAWAVHDRDTEREAGAVAAIEATAAARDELLEGWRPLALRFADLTRGRPDERPAGSPLPVAAGRSPDTASPGAFGYLRP